MGADPALTRFLVHTAPLIDVRAPAEHARGAFPNAVSLPLLTDRERQRVGIAYSQFGQANAIARGRELVSGALKESRVDGWRNVIRDHPGAGLYCWRGGLRSATAAEWLAEDGIAVDLVPGGYKALRKHCLNVLADPAAGVQLVVVGGRTGIGKTALLAEFAGAIDLEALARHRGSAFGHLPGGQPTPIAFENALAIALLERGHREVLLLEDEGPTIGRLALPAALYERMSRSPLVLIEGRLHERARHILAEYVHQPFARGDPAAVVRERYRDALKRIQRRLGGLRYQRIDALVAAAFDGDGGVREDAHLAWIEALLADYYDPMYDHQLNAKSERVVFRGDRAEVAAYLRERCGGV